MCRAWIVALTLAAFLGAVGERGTAQCHRRHVRDGCRLRCRRGFPPMPDAGRVVRDWYTERLEKYFARRYRAYALGKDRDDEYNELGRAAVRLTLAERERLPAEVRAARDFYWKHFEEEDIGSAPVYRARVRGKVVYVIRVSTDGDDGYQEFYDGKGRFLAASRRYLEVLAWGSRDWLRAQAAQPGSLPPELKDAPRRTLWGRPLRGVHCNQRRDHVCTALPPGRCVEMPGHVRADGTPHRCWRCDYTWGGKPKPPEPPAPQVVPWEVELHPVGEYKYTHRLLETHVTIETKQGRVTVPVADIKQIDLAARRRGRARPGKAERKSDVVRTAGARYTGKLEGDHFTLKYPDYTSPLAFSELKRVRALTAEEVYELYTFHDPDTLLSEGGGFGQKRRYRMTGTTEGPVYGTDTYALDSHVPAAAVHAGLLRPGERGDVVVEIVPSPPRFRGTTRHGVTSASAEEFSGGAFRFVGRGER